MRPVFKIIIFYEIFFFVFWNIIYYSNSDVENWFEAKILTAIFTILTTMALGFVFVKIVNIAVKILAKPIFYI